MQFSMVFYVYVFIREQILLKALLDTLHLPNVFQMCAEGFVSMTRIHRGYINTQNKLLTKTKIFCIFGKYLDDNGRSQFLHYVQTDD